MREPCLAIERTSYANFGITRHIVVLATAMRDAWACSALGVCLAAETPVFWVKIAGVRAEQRWNANVQEICIPPTSFSQVLQSRVVRIQHNSSLAFVALC